MYFTFVIYTRSDTDIKASELSLSSYSAVVFAGILHWISWHYLSDIWALAGIGLMVIGGLLILHPGDN
jgi:drug/metabolite transporter (DMT)-like permease